MATLSVDVWHLICQELDPDECRPLRLVCRELDRIASCYSLPEVPFYLHQQDFAALRAIADNSTVARNVKSLTYIADMMGTDERKTLSDFIELHQESERLEKEDAEIAGDKYVSKRLNKSKLKAYYKTYLKTIDQEEEALAKSLDYECLRAVIPKFTSLESVLVSAHAWGREDWDSKSPFDDCLLEPIDTLLPIGCRHLEAVVDGLRGLDHKIQRLYAGKLSYKFFDRTPTQYQELRDICSNLTGLEIEIDTRQNMEDYLGRGVPACRSLMDKGVLRDFLAALPHLKVLSVTFTHRDRFHDLHPAALEHVLKPGHQWPDLQELTLRNIETERQKLLAALELHQKTLRTLGLEFMTLNTTSWLKLLPDIRHGLDLTEAWLVGATIGHSETSEGLGEFWDLSVMRGIPARLRDNVTDYLTKSAPELLLSHSNMGHTFDDEDDDIDEELGDWDEDDLFNYMNAGSDDEMDADFVEAYMAQVYGHMDW